MPARRNGQGCAGVKPCEAWEWSKSCEWRCTCLEKWLGCAGVKPCEASERGKSCECRKMKLPARW